MTTNQSILEQSVAKKNTSTVSLLPTSKCQPICDDVKEENDNLTPFEQHLFEQWEFSHCAYSDLDLHF